MSDDRHERIFDSPPTGPLYTRRTPTPLVIHENGFGGKLHSIVGAAVSVPTKHRPSLSKTIIGERKLPSHCDPHSGHDSGVEHVDDTEASETELDLDLVSGGDDSDNDVLGTPQSLTFDDSHAPFTVAETVDPHTPTRQPEPPSTGKIVMAWLSLAIAALSLSAVGPTFLYLERDKSVPAMLAACWRCQAMLVFLSIPAAIEWFRIDASNRKWSNLHVPPSPTLLASEHHNVANTAVSLNLSDSNFAGVESEIEMTDLDKLSNFLDDQNNLPMIQDMANEFENDSDSDDRDRRMKALTSMIDDYDNRHAVDMVSMHDSAAAAVTVSDVWPPIKIRTIVPNAKTPTKHVVHYLLLASIGWGGSLALWVTALCFTSTARASLFSSTYPLLILAYMKFVKGINISTLEIIGVFVALIGIVTSESMNLFTASPLLHDDATGSPTSSCPHTSLAHTELLGDMLCLCGSVLIALQITSANRARQVLPLFSFTFASTFIVTLVLASLTLLLEGSDFSTSTQSSLIGFLFDWELFALITVFGFIVGFLGVLGHNYSVAVVNPIVFASAQLVDPGLTAMISYVAGLEGWPPASTFVGVAIVTLGIACVVVGEYRRTARLKEVSAKHAYTAVKSDPS